MLAELHDHLDTADPNAAAQPDPDVDDGSDDNIPLAQRYPKPGVAPSGDKAVTAAAGTEESLPVAADQVDQVMSTVSLLPAIDISFWFKIAHFLSFTEILDFQG